jgi:hypothetical protein
MKKLLTILVLVVLIAGCTGQEGKPIITNQTEEQPNMTNQTEEPPVQPPSISRKPFIFDIVYTGFSQTHMQEIRNSHVTNLTLFVCWSQIETANETFDWTFPDERVGKYTELGMPPAGAVVDWWEGCHPEWLANESETGDAYISELNNFAELAAARYGSRIKYWMVGNELNGQYWHGRYSHSVVLLQKNVSAAVKKGWPDAQVGTRLAFDDWDVSLANWAPFLDEVKANLDWVGIQAYPVGAGFHPGDHALKQAIELARSRSGGLPVWVTETGVSQCQCEQKGATVNNYDHCYDGNSTCSIWVDETRQVIWMHELIHDAWDADAIGVSVYRWGDPQYSLINEVTYFEQDYGFKEKPVLSALRNDYAELQGS